VDVITNRGSTENMEEREHGSELQMTGPSTRASHNDESRTSESEYGKQSEDENEETDKAEAHRGTGIAERAQARSEGKATKHAEKPRTEVQQQRGKEESQSEKTAAGTRAADKPRRRPGEGRRKRTNRGTDG
jgi:hypothetical protein